MRKWFFFGAIALAAAVYFGEPKRQPLPFISFDTSMTKALPTFTKIYDSKPGHQWKILKSLYENNLKKIPSISPRIPKIIHQVWLGGPLPEKYRPLQKTWQEKHPDWEYRLWTDADVPNFPFTNKKRFEEAITFGEKSDILRYEILSAYGGLYVDTDFECIAPFDTLHHTCDFYAGALGAYLEGQEVHIGNALIGSVPHHPVLQYCLERIVNYAPGTTADDVQAISGPGCFKRAFFKCCKKSPYRDVIFPYTFFYPLPPQERCGHLSAAAKAQIVEPETLGIHYWDVSWAPEEFPQYDASLPSPLPQQEALPGAKEPPL